MSDLLDSDTRRAARLHETLGEIFDEQERALRDKLDKAMKEEERIRSDLSSLQARRKTVLNNLDNLDMNGLEAVDFLFFGKAKLKPKLGYRGETIHAGPPPQENAE